MSSTFRGHTSFPGQSFHHPGPPDPAPREGTAGGSISPLPRAPFKGEGPQTGTGTGEGGRSVGEPLPAGGVATHSSTCPQPPDPRLEFEANLQGFHVRDLLPCQTCVCKIHNSSRTAS